MKLVLEFKLLPTTSFINKKFIINTNINYLFTADHIINK